MMKLGVVISTNDPETAWNALRYANYALGQGDMVNVFLLGKGVECERLDTEKFLLSVEMNKILAQGGNIRACGTCLKLRGTEDAGECDFSTMADLHAMVVGVDRLLTF